jgi:hypothetical protein
MKQPDTGPLELGWIVLRGSYQTEGLDDQSPAAHEAPDDKPSQHRLDLRYTAVLRIDCVLLDQHGSADGEENGEEYEEEVLKDEASHRRRNVENCTPRPPVFAISNL